MRAGVGAVQHTLTAAAASVVKAAVAEAKTRGHSQVQPLHVAAILLLPSSSGNLLRRACLESHNKDPSHPLQCRALELCFKIALDRLPYNQEKTPNPVLSNALVAALKRAQAHQRRGTPEQSLQPLLAVKVEMDQLIISILDDPSVSRVMREAGFSSTDVKCTMEEAAALQASSFTCSSTSLDNSSPLGRRERMPAASFGVPVLENSQLRTSLFSSSSSPLMMDPLTKNVQTVERCTLSGVAEQVQSKEALLLSTLHGRAGDAHAYPHAPPALMEKPPLFANRLEQSRLFPQAPVLVSGGSGRQSSHEADLRNVVDALLKRSNPVLVSDVGLHTNSLVVKEFSHKLKSGDVPPFLKGVNLLNFPFNSLTIGLFGVEEIKDKLSQLRSFVEVSMQSGAILSLGDLQWLVEPDEAKSALVHAHTDLAIQELCQLLEKYSNQRFWILATASSQTFVACQTGDLSLKTRLNLQPVLVAASPGGLVHSRSNLQENRRSIPFPQVHAVPAIPLLTKLRPPVAQEVSDVFSGCAECAKKLQDEVSRLIQHERLVQSGLSPWVSIGLVKPEEDLSVKNPSTSHQIQILREKWTQICASQHSGSQCDVSTVTQCPRDIISANVSGCGNTSFVERSPSLQSPLIGSSKWPEPVKFMVAKSTEHTVPVPSKAGILPQWAAAYTSVSPVSLRREAPVSGVEQNISLGGLMKKNSLSGAGVGLARSSVSVNTRSPSESLGVDLALGRSSPSTAIAFRDLMESGEQPVRGNLELSIGGNLGKECTPKVTLPWLVSQSAATDSSKREELGLSASLTNRPSDMDLVKRLWRGLQDIVPWQRDVCNSVASTVSDTRSGNGKRRGVTAKQDTWLLFLGPDRVGKREVAKALAKVVFGDEKKLIWMQLSGSNVDKAVRGPGDAFLASDSNGVRYRGRTPLDRLVEAVRLKPFSVVLLEDVDRADSMVRAKLMKAMARGKLASSSGKEVSFANVIVVMTCSAGSKKLCCRSTHGKENSLSFDEESLARRSSHNMKIQVDDLMQGQVVHSGRNGVSVVEYSCDDKDFSSSSHSLSKRRARWSVETDGCGLTRDKRPRKDVADGGRARVLDLNLSAEENEVVDDGLGETDSSETPEEPEEVLAMKVLGQARDVLPKEMFDAVDATVMFKPFDFENLVEGLVHQVEEAFTTVTNQGWTVEIDVEVLEQLASAVWQTYSDRTVFSSWIKDVLVKSLSLFLESRAVVSSSSVKLTVDRVQTLDTQAVGLLPAAIKLVS